MAPLAEVAGIAGPHLPQGDRPGAPDVGRLRAENESLRAQLTASETVAHEREQRIEDLLAALRGLPQAWMDYMERTGGEQSPGERAQRAGANTATVIDVLAARPDEASKAPPAAVADVSPAIDPAELAAAEVAWRDARALRDRLERDRLDRELERIRTRKRGRFLHGLRRAS